MAGPKQKTAAKKSRAVRSKSRKKTAAAASVQKRAARDVSVGPSAKRIERSLEEGTKQTLDFFRGTINWS
jgi:hypothetical protein